MTVTIEKIDDDKYNFIEPVVETTRTTRQSYSSLLEHKRVLLARIEKDTGTLKTINEMIKKINDLNKEVVKA